MESRKTKASSVLDGSRVYWVVLFGLCMFAACNSPAPTPQVVTPVATVAVTAVSTRVDPAVATVLASLTPQSTAAAIAATTPTATAATTATVATATCQLPATWVAYRVQLFDTLSSLAAQTGTTLNEIKDANCLLDDLIIEGELLYVPFVPPPPVVLGILDEEDRRGREVETDCSLSCAEHTLADLPFPLAGPGGDYVPCQPKDGTVPMEPWISFRTEAQQGDDGTLDPARYDRHVGQRGYYFFCFPEGAQLDETAVMRWSGGSELLPVQTNMVDPERNLGQATGFAVWSAICDPERPLPTNETYTLSIGDDQNRQATLSFTLHPAEKPTILAVPQVLSPGDPLSIYYCGYPNEMHELTSHSFYETAFFELGLFYQLSHNRSWEITLDQQGRHKQTLQTQTTDPARFYLLADFDPSDPNATGVRDSFWLVP